MSARVPSSGSDNLPSVTHLLGVRTILTVQGPIGCILGVRIDLCDLGVNVFAEESLTRVDEMIGG